MAKPGRLYVQVDVNFWEDDKVLRAGERAAAFYVRCLCMCKRVQSDGWLSDAQLSMLGVRDWRAQVAQLVKVGLLKREGNSTVHVVGWLDWNESVGSARQRAEANRERARDWRRRQRQRDSDEG